MGIQMVLGVLQGKARKDFVFIDLPELLSPSQLEKNQKNNGGEGKAWPHELSLLISLLVSGSFSCSGQANDEITFFPLLFNPSPVFPRGRRSQYLPSWSFASEEESAWTCTPTARGWWVWFFSKIHLLIVPFGKRLNAFNFPQNCVRISCRHELLWQWSEVFLALVSTKEGGRVAGVGSIFLIFTLDSTMAIRLPSQPWKWVSQALNPTSCPLPFLSLVNPNL